MRSRIGHEFSGADTLRLWGWKAIAAGPVTERGVAPLKGYTGGRPRLPLYGEPP